MATEPQPKWRKIVIGAATAAIVITALFVLRSTGIELRQAAQWLTSVGDRWWAPAAFIALYAIFTTCLLPATILTLTAGVVWGWFAGGLWVLAASTIGSAIPYWIAYSGSRRVEEIISRRAPRLRTVLENEGFMTLLLLRLLPIVPYNVLNYAAGLARIGRREYLSATFIGTIPGIFIFTYLASSIASGLVSPQQAFVRILIAGGLLATLALASRFFSNRLRSRLAR